MDYMSKHNKLEQVLEINDTSLYELEKELKEFPKNEGEVQRMYAEITQTVNNLITRVEIVTSQMVEKIVEEYRARGDKVSFTSKDIIRKTEVPLRKEYQEVKKQLDEANTQKTYILGLCKSMASKSHRLTELTNLMMKYRHDELFIPVANRKYEDMANAEGMDMER